MRVLSLLSTLLALAAAAPTPQDGHEHEHGAGGTGEMATSLPAGFYVEPKIDMTKPKTPGAKTIKIRTGPYNLKAGATLSTLASNVKKPCENCFIVAADSDLEYADGSIANVNTGAWLHHMVLYARGGSNKDLVCPSSLLYGSRRRIFATGNERTPARVNSDMQAGIQIRAADNFGMIIELMSESTKDQQVWIIMNYEYLEGAAATGYTEGQVAWLDATGCGASSVAAKTGQFSYRSPGWKSTLSGTMLFAAGHLHDGGTNATVLVNGKVACVSDQLYGRTEAFRAPAGSAHAGGLHISDASACRNFGKINKGDELVVVGNYDMNKYPGQMHDGKAHPVMAIALVFIA